MSNKDTQPTIKLALTIAGSDSGGGAGIQADLRTFAFHCVHGTSAVTCITAQNTTGVSRVDPLSPESVLAQISAITSDMKVHAAKTGMLLNGPIIHAVADRLADQPINHLVVDPVMVSRAGDQLLDDNAQESMIKRMLPIAEILTPNRFEAELLSGIGIETIDDMKNAAKKIHRNGPANVLVKGGGLIGKLRGTDVWFDGEETKVLTTECVETVHTHGTGCTLSAAITANLALGLAPFEACVAAKKYVTNALKHPLAIGKGRGPVGHFYPLIIANRSETR